LRALTDAWRTSDPWPLTPLPAPTVGVRVLESAPLGLVPVDSTVAKSAWSLASSTQPRKALDCLLALIERGGAKIQGDSPVNLRTALRVPAPLEIPWSW